MLPAPGFIDTQDESPEHPIVYQGLTHKAERYLAMACYICGLYSYSIFGNFASSSTASSSSSSLSSNQKSPASLVDPVGRGLVSTHAPLSRKKPYSKPKSKQSTQQEQQNKFLFHPNPFNPAIVPVWSEAQAELALLSTTLPASELGYFLPDPDMIISSPNDKTKRRLVYSWLKLRELFIFRLSSRQARSVSTLLHNQQWQHLLAVAAGIKYSAETESGRKHEEMRQLLAGYVDETWSGIQLKLENLSSAPVAWR
ncbi:hypothetical protein K435DRAFT_875016 [Dendrothele bispora CBS 962.96]|uniref:Uncharacterized protein n=1 Tax=Dendrothele bispora (strain CBS 962.96) TaxID=1314807 RepID=A0A4S8KVL6_DENBC|nr:hypothetical protein K435DRAFT_875016 [Dendrothele bispora CBS 962.96]